MPVRFECPSCFHTANVSSKLEGKKVKCPQCGQAVRIGSYDDDMLPSLPPRRSGGPDTPRRKATSRSNVPVAAYALGGLAIAVVVVVAFLAGRAGRSPEVAAPPVPDPAPVAATPPSGQGVEAIAVQPPSQPLSVAATSEPSATPAEPTTLTSPPGLTPVRDQAVSPDPSENAQPDESSPDAARPPILDTASLVESVEPSIVRINALDESGEIEWHGSGFVADAAGLIVTNAHVVAGAATCVAVFADGTNCPVTGYYSMNEKNDLAVIAIDVPDKKKLVALPISPEIPRKGESVFAFGCPHGLDFTTSDGIVSAVRSQEELEGLRGEPTLGTWIQTTAPISSGNSGGPLVNSRGEVVGINAMVHSLGQNLNFAVSAAEAASELKAKPATLAKLSRDTAPEEERHLKGIDLTNDPLGKEKLAAIKKLAVLPLTGFGPVNWETINILKNSARFELERANIEVVSVPEDDLPVLLLGVISHRERTFARRRISLKALLVVLEKENSDLPKMYTIWENESDLGTITFGKSMSRQTLNRIKDFFGRLGDDYKAAVAAHSAPAATP